MALFETINLVPHSEQATRNRGVDILVSNMAARSRFPLELVGEIPIKGNAENARTSLTKPLP